MYRLEVWVCVCGTVCKQVEETSSLAREMWIALYYDYYVMISAYLSNKSDIIAVKRTAKEC